MRHISRCRCRGQHSGGRSRAPLSLSPHNFCLTVAIEHTMISYERLEVYQLSLKCTQQCLEVLQDVPRGYAELRQQLRRAIISVSLNIAEGAGKTGLDSKKNFYDIAKGSAMESAAIIDILQMAKFIDAARHSELKELLHRIISMLSKLCLNLERRSTG